MRMRSLVLFAASAVIAAACSGSSTTTTSPATPTTPVATTASTSSPPTTAPAGPSDDAGASVASTISVDLGEAATYGPDAVAYGAGSLWVSVLADEGNRSEILRIDPDGGEVTARIPVSEPGSASFGAGALWVANFGSGGTYRIDPATNQATLSPEGGDLVVAGDEGVWVVGSDDVLTQLNPADGSKIRTIEVVARDVVERSVPAGLISSDFDGSDELPFEVDSFGSMALGFGSLWATIDARDGLLGRVDTTTGEVTDILLLPPLSASIDLAGTFAMASSGGRLWVLVEFTDVSSGVMGINPDTVEVDVNVVLPLGEGTTLWRMATTPDRIYAIDDFQTLYVIDPATQDLVSTVELDTEFIQDVAVGGGAVWITDLDQDRVVVVR